MFPVLASRGLGDTRVKKIQVPQAFPVVVSDVLTFGNSLVDTTSTLRSSDSCNMLHAHLTGLTRPFVPIQALEAASLILT